MAQHLTSIHATCYFYFAEYTDSVPQTFALEVQLKLKHFIKALIYGDRKSSTLHRDRDYMKGMTFVRFSLVIRGEDAVQMLTFSGHFSMA